MIIMPTHQFNPNKRKVPPSLPSIKKLTTRPSKAMNLPIKLITILHNLPQIKIKYELLHMSPVQCYKHQNFLMDCLILSEYN